MAIREIIKVPNPILKKVSKPVDQVDDEIRGILDDMLDTMYDAPGIGLAAIQIGIPLRMLVIDISYIGEKENNEKIGSVGIKKHAMFKEPDLAWQVFKDYEGMGYAYEAAIAVKDYCIHNFKFSSLASHIVEGNKNSISLAERVGYKIKKEEIIDNKKFIIYFHI